MDGKLSNGTAYLRATRIGAKLQDIRWESDELYRKNLVAEIEELGENFALWMKQNFYRQMKSKAAHPRIMALNYFGAVGEIGAGDLLKSEIFDDAFIQEIIRLAEGGSQKEEQKLEAIAAYALMGLEIGRRDGKLLPTILAVLSSFHNQRLLKNISKMPYDEKTVNVLVSILSDDFLLFRQEGMKTIVEYWTSYWASCALLEIGDERGIETMVRTILGKFSTQMGRQMHLSVEMNVFSRYADFLTEAGKPVVKYLIRGLSSDDHHVCRLAVTCLGRIGDPSAFERLARFITSDVIGAKFNTANAFGELGDPRAIPLLLPMLGSKTPGVYPAVKHALTRLRQDWQAREFIDVLQHEDEKVVIFSVDALGEIKDLSAVEPLRSLLESDNRKIRKAAKKSLKKIR